MGLFGGLFDFNGDGKLDMFEESAEFSFFMNMLDLSDEDELSDAGLNIDELELMDDYERREALEDAGLDPDEYDF